MSRYNHNVCSQYVGQMVHVHTTKGVHRGYVDRVSKSGMYLRPIPDGAHASAHDVLLDLTHADGTRSVPDARHVFYGGYGGYGRGYGGYGYGPYAAARVFVPFLTILALTSLLWW